MVFHVLPPPSGERGYNGVPSQRQNLSVVFSTEHLQHRASVMNKIARRKILGWFAVSCLLSSSALFAQTSPSPLAESRQMVLVITENWEKIPGKLQKFERSRIDQAWEAVGTPIDTVVGRGGMAWGRGLFSETNSPPQKREGDGKSPAGVFRLSSAFGFASPDEMKALRLPYRQVTDELECVDDVKSARYNSIVNASQIEKRDWESSEKMREVGAFYHLGVVVAHNAAPRIAGKGSCIFLHIWKGDGSGTSGCTAMKESEMRKLMFWLDSNANPILIQLPQKEYLRLRDPLNLPKAKWVSAK
ncbi:MAG: L,D-transpeptidase family protein [Verrucomicrobiota bacterium]